MTDESPHTLSSTTIVGIAIAYLLFIALVVIVFA